MIFLSSVDLFNINFQKILQQVVLTFLDLDQVQCFVWPDLGSNCMKRSAADDFLPLADSSLHGNILS